MGVCSFGADPHLSMIVKLGIVSYVAASASMPCRRSIVHQPEGKQWRDEQDEERNCEMAVEVGNRFTATATHKGYSWSEDEVIAATEMPRMRQTDDSPAVP